MTNRKDEYLYTQEETTLVVEGVVSLLPKGREGAVVLLLSGELGAGKTSFVQFLARYLGVKERVMSPTFVIQKEYVADGTCGFEKLVHIDAYRLASLDDLNVLGFSHFLNNEKALICIEWPERVPGIEALVPHTLSLSFEHASDTKRLLRVVY